MQGLEKGFESAGESLLASFASKMVSGHAQHKKDMTLAADLRRELGCVVQWRNSLSPSFTRSANAAQAVQFLDSSIADCNSFLTSFAGESLFQAAYKAQDDKDAIERLRNNLKDAQSQVQMRLGSQPMHSWQQQQPFQPPQQMQQQQLYPPMQLPQQYWHTPLLSSPFVPNMQQQLPLRTQTWPQLQSPHSYAPTWQPAAMQPYSPSITPTSSSPSSQLSPVNFATSPTTSTSFTASFSPSSQSSQQTSPTPQGSPVPRPHVPPRPSQAAANLLHATVSSSKADTGPSITSSRTPQQALSATVLELRDSLRDSSLPNEPLVAKRLTALANVLSGKAVILPAQQVVVVFSALHTALRRYGTDRSVHTAVLEVTIPLATASGVEEALKDGSFIGLLMDIGAESYDLKSLTASCEALAHLSSELPPRLFVQVDCGLSTFLRNCGRGRAVLRDQALQEQLCSLLVNLSWDSSCCQDLAEAGVVEALLAICQFHGLHLDIANLAITVLARLAEHDSAAVASCHASSLFLFILNHHLSQTDSAIVNSDKRLQLLKCSLRLLVVLSLHDQSNQLLPAYVSEAVLEVALEDERYAQDAALQESIWAFICLQCQREDHVSRELMTRLQEVGVEQQLSLVIAKHPNSHKLHSSYTTLRHMLSPTHQA